MLKEINIPFCGFYESAADSAIDQEIESAFDTEGTGDSCVPESFWDHWDSKEVTLAFARHYTECFESYINENLHTEIKLIFKAMESPREYNFCTDRIFADISQEDILKLAAGVDNEILAKVIKDRCTSYDGFTSFYPNSINADKWQIPVVDWDHNQLNILLEAYFISADISADYYEIMEDSNCTGELDSIVWNNCPKECQDLANAAHEASQGG